MHDKLPLTPGPSRWTAPFFPAPASSVPHEPGHSTLVFVVDGDAASRDALATLVDGSGRRTECFPSAQEFLGRAPHAGPSCLVLDVNLPHAQGIELQRRIVAERSGMPVIATTGKADVPVAVQAMKAGAMDFLAKPICASSLLRAVDEALARSRAAIAQAVDMQDLRVRYDALTAREQEVMSLVVRGLLNKQVGAELGICEVTVKAHRGNAMRKMGARTLPDLVNMAARLGEAVQLAA
ncbi:response regulator transcription factor [Variovorax sp. OV329]|uniref:response regulator transcription factor n=1 Tax=Variovorax sp. OV329 TaxID=1882825 RepID=UPI0008E92B6A|nr:response regulator [Variovorax sp. OV329]SFN03144.1 two component transcriptional regulator, LuxR family [Variovorax sp. OV329]